MADRPRESGASLFVGVAKNMTGDSTEETAMLKRMEQEAIA